MAGRKKRGGRRAYLNDFKVGEGGQYSYMGTVYAYAGGRPYKKEMLLLGAFTGIMVLAVIAVGCIPAASMLGINNFYVAPLYIFELIAVFITAWGVVRLFLGGRKLRAYVYEATVKKLPIRAVITAVAAGLLIPANIVSVILKGVDGKLFAGIAVIVLHALTVLAALLLRGTVLKESWMAEMPDEKQEAEDVFPPYEGE